MDKIYKIYKIDFPSGKCYIGQTNDIQRRWREHLWEASVARCDIKVYRAMQKYKTTIDCFSVIEDNIPTQEEACEKEKYYIKKYDSYHNGYNSTPGGECGPYLKGETNPNAVLSDVEILKIRQIRASKEYTVGQVYAFYKDKVSYSGFEKIWTYETRTDVAPELNTPELTRFYETDKRMMTGDKHFLSKFTDKQVVEIRNKYWVQGISMKEIYKAFKDLYSLSGFQKIVLGYTYTNVPMPKRSTKCKKKQDLLSKETVLDIRAKYKNGTTVMEIIRTWYPDLSESVVCQIVHNKSYKNY